MRKPLAVPLVLLLGLALPSSILAQHIGTRAIKEFDAALTDAGFFGIPRYTTALLPACTSQNKGSMAFDTTAVLAKVCSGAAWVSLAGAALSGNNTFTGTNVFQDAAKFQVCNQADLTKCIQFDASVIATGTARTFTLPNVSATLAVLTAQTFIGDQTLSSASLIAATNGFGVQFGGATDDYIAFSSSQTPSSAMLLTGGTSNAWIIARRSDVAFNFGHALQANPTLFVHSAAQNTGQWMGLSHGGSYSIITSGTGGLGIIPFGATTPRFYADQNQIGGHAAAQIGFGSNATDASATVLDAFWTRANTASIRQGANAAGTNIAAANQTYQPPSSTGNAAAATLGLARGLMTASGTTVQATADAVRYCGTKTLSNTTGTLTTLATIALPSNSSGAVNILVSVQCNDGTNFDSDAVTSTVSYVNKAATITFGTPATTSSTAINNSGSCTIAPTFTAGSSLININVTPVITTIVPTTTTAFVEVHNLGTGAVTCN